MGVLVEKTKMHITNVNPRKEGSGEGMVLASDVSVEFTARRTLMDRLVPNQKTKFSDQFYADDGSVRLESVYPIVSHKKHRDLKVLLWFGNKPIVFDGATLQGSTAMTPEPGGHMNVKAKLQLHPTSDQSGKLDAAVKEWVDVEIATMTDDIEDAGTDAGDE